MLDPFAPTRYRRTAERLAVLKALEAPTTADRLAALVERAPFGVDLERFARAGNVRDLERLPYRGTRAGSRAAASILQSAHRRWLRIASRGDAGARSFPSRSPGRIWARWRTTQADRVSAARRPDTDAPSSPTSSRLAVSPERAVAASAGAQQCAVAAGAGAGRENPSAPARCALRPPLGSRSGGKPRAAGTAGTRGTDPRVQTRRNLSGRARPLLPSRRDSRSGRAGQRPSVGRWRGARRSVSRSYRAGSQARNPDPRIFRPCWLYPTCSATGISCAPITS